LLPPEGTKAGARATSHVKETSRMTGHTPARSAKFTLGTVVATPGALEAISRHELVTAIQRHAQGDWGEVDPHDHRQNEQALESGLRLFSVYRTLGGEKFWVITEADRSSTTILLPSEY
jgi:hypothetical protein